LIAAALVESGCGGSDSAPAAKSSTVEIFSWWVSGSETKALDALLGVYKSAHPGISVINAAVASAANAQAELTKRMTQGLPPDTFQVGGGIATLAWVKYNGKDDLQSKLEPIEGLQGVADWLSVTPQAIKDQVSYNGHVYGVAVNVHRQNCLFYNKKIFDDNKLTPPKTLADFFTVADALKAKGITPLALGSQGSWTTALLFWENVLEASAGPGYVLDFLKGKKSANDPEIRTALEATAKVLGYVNSDADQLSWDQAVGLVSDGKAAMNFMGDWAKGEFLANGKKPGVDFDQVTWGDMAFVFGIDVFVLPKGAPDRQNAVDLITTMGSSAGQNAFNPIKGSIPTRTDATPMLYDAISQQDLADFKVSTLVPTHSSLVPTEFSDPVDKAFGPFAKDKNVDNMILAIKNYYDVIAKQQ
jgi:glucose/mannose transport system substrate-binding protein